ncbi:DNA repair protein RecN [Nocardioides marmoribigeumensis]|uniref:DNA repair protein RecN n=1 Tax=Nocardioides marmoribigeumensis TaxID=433649 RepID=A0ABU2BQM5_9ACTN|nr:DNA repair protein RecN [Nocardioides marmoribigeumensis]MDR7360938.1 DNA repair protein RecN (Recombination protein N) [Nocardioides marmoribigeumensis]
MLEELRIVGLGVIDESVLELGPGFTAITGETGAGKTMLVTALGLLLGGRADSGAVRTGARQARVEGVLDLAGTQLVQELRTTVEEAGGQLDGERLMLARQVSAEGRSRAYAGGAGVPAGVLSAIADRVVAVHGQSDQHQLLSATAQRDALDRYAGAEALRLRSEFAAAHAELRAVEAEREELLTRSRERAREVDLLRFGLEEIEQVAPAPGEDAALAEEESRLGFADTLRTAAEQAREMLSAEQGGPDALGAVGAARRLLDGVRDHDAAAGELADRLAEVGYLLGDLAADTASYASGLETDPARLAAVSERRAALVALTRKYGDSIDEVIAWSAEAAARLGGLEGADDRIGELEARAAELASALAATGAALSAVRAEAAERLAHAVSEELTALAMPHAQVEARVTQAEAAEGLEVDGRRLRMNATGLDDVELLLAANRGAEARPLHKGASGGELSRVMLGLEVVLAGTNPVPTMVFDEVDAGVGGKAAVEVGRRLAMLARDAQVVVVTHLPQVAAFADRHVVVAKSSDGLVTTSGLTLLDDTGRVRELSRMLAGLEGSDSAQAHAEELLATARALT